MAEIKEKHYTVKELAELWHLSRNQASKMFANEPDVIVWTTPRLLKRPYRTIRIPESVAQRVYQRSKVITIPKTPKGTPQRFRLASPKSA